MKVFLTGRVAVEIDGAVIDDARFPGRQGRLLFAYLAVELGRPVPRDALAGALWGETPPATWEKALAVLVSKLRALLASGGNRDQAVLTGAFGCYRLELPEGSWVDVLAAQEAVREAENALDEGDLERCRATAEAAESILRQSFLPGAEGAWVEDKRRELDDLRLHAVSALADASLRSGEAAAAVTWSEQAILLEPFREGSYRRLMQAHAAAGNPAEALRVYERCRLLLAEELGAYPSHESETLYLEILRNQSGSVADAERLENEAPQLGPLRSAREQRRGGGRAKLALALAAAVTVLGAVLATLAFTRGDPAPPEVLPSSVVRIDPKTLAPTKVVPINPRADLVFATGGFVWITHGILRYTDNGGLRNAGDRTLTRVDPKTGEARVVGGVAPCGLTADPSGDIWVANCYAVAANANVMRVDARTLNFDETWTVPASRGFAKGMAYGGGTLWLTDGNSPPRYRRVIAMNPNTGDWQSIRLNRHPTWLTWSGGYGDLWLGDFEGGSVLRMDVATGRVEPHRSIANNPGYVVVEGGTVWVGDWDVPDVVRVPAIGSRPARHIRLPVTTRPAGVTTLATGNGYIWATVPDDRALWRIDPRTNQRTRIRLPYFPWGVAVADDGGVWVTVRGRVSA